MAFLGIAESRLGKECDVTNGESSMSAGHYCNVSSTTIDGALTRLQPFAPGQ